MWTKCKNCKIAAFRGIKIPPYVLICAKKFLPVKEHFFMNLYKKLFFCDSTVEGC